MLKLLMFNVGIVPSLSSCQILQIGRSQLILVRSVAEGDAQELWTALENAYGAVRNSNTIASLYSTLSNIIKLESQPMKDYISQIQSMFID